MKKLAIYFCLTILLSCSTSKQLSYEELMAGAPQWVKQTPNQRDYYHGVGMATKAGTPDDYREVARQNALSELASGISVNISATSVLNQYEFNNEYNEYYRDNIRLSTQQYLEGYELVDNWENPQQYWVYYRLSKSRYNEIKQERIDKAISSSKTDFFKARDFANEGNTTEAMRFYVSSLEDIKDFLGEDLNTEIEGKNEGFSSLLFSEVTRRVQNLRVIFPVDEITFKRGKGFENENMQLTVLDENNTPVRGISVNVSFSYAPGKMVKQITDAKGTIKIKLENFDSRRREEFIAAQVDFEKQVKESTNDPVLRKLLQNIQATEFVLPVKIAHPTFFIESEETNLGNELQNSTINREFRSLLERDGIEVVNNQQSADYTLTATVSTEKDKSVNGKFTTLLSASFQLKSPDGQTLYSENIIGLTGLGSSFEIAGSDAYKSLGGKIRINIYPAMYKSLFKSDR